MSDVASNNFQHPPALRHLSTIAILFVLAFAVINSLLILYLRTETSFTNSQAYVLFATYNSLIFTLPLVGGFLAQKLGYKNAVAFGLCLGVIGCLLLSIHTMHGLFWGLGFFAIGNALATPSLYTMLGLTYSKDDKRRDSGYTLFYLLFNIGFFLAAIIGGWLSRDISYDMAFMVAAFATALALLTLVLTSKNIQAFPGRSMEPQVSSGKWGILGYFLLYAIIGIPVTFYLLSHDQLTTILLWAVAGLTFIGIIVYALRKLEGRARHRMLAFAVLCVISVMFWILYSLEPSLLTVFIAHQVNRSVFGVNVPAASYYSLEPLFIILLGLFFTWLWGHLQRKNRDISLPGKFSCSLWSMTIGYLIFPLAIFLTGEAFMLNSLWIVLAYMFLTAGELLISPIGISMVGKLCPAGTEGTMMGVWQVFTGFAAILSGTVANQIAIGSHNTLAQANHAYSKGFLHIGIATLIVAIIALLLIPKLKHLITD